MSDGHMWQFFPFLICKWLHVEVWKAPSNDNGEYENIFGGYPLLPSDLHGLLFHVDPIIFHLNIVEIRIEVRLVI